MSILYISKIFILPEFLLSHFSETEQPGTNIRAAVLKPQKNHPSSPSKPRRNLSAPHGSHLTLPYWAS